jgi:hypothetical protein
MNKLAQWEFDVVEVSLQEVHVLRFALRVSLDVTTVEITFCYFEEVATIVFLLAVSIYHSVLL